MQLNVKYLEVIKEICHRVVPNYNVYLFGSRAKDSAQKYSDIDLLFYGKDSLSFLERARLEEEFDESNLPFFVDIVDAQDMEESYKEEVWSHRILLIKSTHK